MAIIKKETTKQGQVASYHKIVGCALDTKYGQLHIDIGSYTSASWREKEKEVIREISAALEVLKLQQIETAKQMQILDHECDLLQSKITKLVDEESDIQAEENVLRSEEIAAEQQARLEANRQKQAEFSQALNDDMEARYACEKQLIELQAEQQHVEATPAVERCLFTRRVTLTGNLKDQVLDLIYPQIMELEPFSDGKKG